MDMVSLWVVEAALAFVVPMIVSLIHERVLSTYVVLTSIAHDFLLWTWWSISLLLIHELRLVIWRCSQNRPVTSLKRIQAVRDGH